MIITMADYAGIYLHHPDFTQEVKDKAIILLHKVNVLTAIAEQHGVESHVNPVTKTYISGTHDGGFRPKNCKTGALLSRHKTGEGLDKYDPKNEFDIWLVNNEPLLRGLGLWFEVSYKTNGWCHCQSVAPASGNRFFVP